MRDSLNSQLPDYVRSRMADVVLATGYPIQVSEAPALEFDSVVSIGIPSSPVHQITYSPGFRGHLIHFVLGSTEKARRYYAASPEDRALPVIDSSALLPDDEDRELRRRVPGVPSDVLDQMSRYLRSGLTRQLLSFPLDARVERDLYQSIPEHQDRQRAYLRRQLADLEPHFSPEIEAFSPPTTYACATAMNCGFVSLCADLTGIEPGPAASASPHRERGKKLRALLDQVEQPGHVGDRKAADLWAQELGLQGWYEWTQIR